MLSRLQGCFLVLESVTFKVDRIRIPSIQTLYLLVVHDKVRLVRVLRDRKACGEEVPFAVHDVDFKGLGWELLHRVDAGSGGNCTHLFSINKIVSAHKENEMGEWVVV